MANISQKWLKDLDVLIPFTEGYNKFIYASSLAVMLKQPQRTVARKLFRLETAGVVKCTLEGKNKMYYIDLHDPQSLILLSNIEHLKALSFLRKHLKISIAIKDLMQLGTIILFGSYAKGQQTSASDIDLLFLSRKSKKAKKLCSKYPFAINPHFTDLQSFSKLLKEDNALAKEIAETHIIFGNVEEIVKVLVKFYG
ncbi:hypothetical protein COV16_02755 [Candidatus Woesearchaeota archaeon CG10_big_fil_rev_8_21_14_0_10_34_8]|nr:MAG: hypothetical protein COV16_02755 [Candidatus Woesearchaeota archaeon CG10_big_fil_rev_8_21_14_0_10_34_8]